MVAIFICFNFNLFVIDCNSGKIPGCVCRRLGLDYYRSFIVQKQFRVPAFYLCFILKLFGACFKVYFLVAFTPIFRLMLYYLFNFLDGFLWFLLFWRFIFFLMVFLNFPRVKLLQIFKVIAVKITQVAQVVHAVFVVCCSQRLVSFVYFSIFLFLFWGLYGLLLLNPKFFDAGIEFSQFPSDVIIIINGQRSSKLLATFRGRVISFVVWRFSCVLIGHEFH